MEIDSEAKVIEEHSTERRRMNEPLGELNGRSPFIRSILPFGLLDFGL